MELQKKPCDSEATPPIYYDSEPSSQSPGYPNAQFTTAKPQLSDSQPKSQNQHRYSAPASTIAAVLATGYDDLDAQRQAERDNKTLRERWRDFKERNFGGYDVNEDRAQAGSAAEWNVMGGKTGGGLASPYWRKDGK
ncbi:hypothetical protein FB567DRAFT_567180 [Paraphoma chrysanthemicola]|uniref:Uncharacterized protein n=1 Tax=Paraphoma chrysanthemicola TaxID=798071 RepID=A0A8K0RCF9_9PLEO|nr:hypothetical protein FB567DRAFT_567180 [Paraphoma chrysanthemicola]